MHTKTEPGERNTLDAEWSNPPTMPDLLAKTGVERVTLHLDGRELVFALENGAAYAPRESTDALAVHLGAPVDSKLPDAFTLRADVGGLPRGTMVIPLVEGEHLTRADAIRWGATIRHEKTHRDGARYSAAEEGAAITAEQSYLESNLARRGAVLTNRLDEKAITNRAEQAFLGEDSKIAASFGIGPVGGPNPYRGHQLHSSQVTPAAAAWQAELRRQNQLEAQGRHIEKQNQARHDWKRHDEEVAADQRAREKRVADLGFVGSVMNFLIPAPTPPTSPRPPDPQQRDTIVITGGSGGNLLAGYSFAGGGFGANSNGSGGQKDRRDRRREAPPHRNEEEKEESEGSEDESAR